eukprot:659014-Heterocapsa_arctica.AAC.1
MQHPRAFTALHPALARRALSLVLARGRAVSALVVMPLSLSSPVVAALVRFLALALVLALGRVVAAAVGPHVVLDELDGLPALD